MQTAYKVKFAPKKESFPGRSYPFMHIKTFKEKDEAKKFVEGCNNKLDFPFSYVKPEFSSIQTNWVSDVDGEFIIEEIKYDYLNREEEYVFSKSYYERTRSTPL